MPAIAITTVVPEMSTVRPDVRAVRSSASCERQPAQALLARADDIEERVVDADRHPDQHHDRLDASSIGNAWLSRPEQAEGGGHGGQREHDGHERGDERAEREQEHEQRDRDREQLGAMKVAVDGVVAGPLAEMSPVCSTVIRGCAAPAARTERRSASRETNCSTEPMSE